ncbi:unnamed protein product [Dibothriocephalus latus]|uniref:Uncharacterized protein n=1 Tax=Dibothriocephalus latus TaxID=60516 RepID=A0A3P7P7Z6_DIBLA|nr:unnamed protein product [Dibothriocephalus latus]
MLQFIKSQFGLDFSLATAEAEHKTRPQDDQQNEKFAQPADLDSSLQLAGTPLPLQEICNLTMADADITSVTEPEASALIDYTDLKIIPTEDFSSQLYKYDMNMLFGLDVGGTVTAFGMTQGPSPIERRILRVRTEQNPDVESKYADLLSMHMPFSEASTLP